MCSFSVVFGCLAAYFSVTNFPVPASRKSGGPFLLDMTCSFACPALGKLIFLPSFPPFKCPGWDREKPYTLTGDTLLLRAPGAWQADDAQQVRSARQESGASRPRTISRPMTWAARRCPPLLWHRAKAPATPAPFSCLVPRARAVLAGMLAPSRRASTRHLAGLVATGAAGWCGCQRLGCWGLPFLCMAHHAVVAVALAVSPLGNGLEALLALTF